MQASQKNGAMTFDEALALTLGALPKKHTAAVEAHVRANLRLQFDYQDQYVAYVDHLKGKGKNAVFSRQILTHARSLVQMYQQLHSIPEEERAGAIIHYVDDPSAPLEIRGMRWEDDHDRPAG